MEEVKNYRYHSTQQFRNVVKSIKDKTRYLGYDEEKKEPIFDDLAVQPKLKYIGTTKLHGTNASIVIHEDGVISFHSKSRLLGYVKDGEFALYLDNTGFAQTMWEIFEGVKHIVEKAKTQIRNVYGGVMVYPVKLSGEWAGSWEAVRTAICAAEVDTDFTLDYQISKLRNVLDGVDQFEFV